jgi:heme/copper-type cytochrome/quinol oxidase subunit 1
MSIKNFLVRLVVYFAIAFTVNAVVLYVWNWASKVDTPFRWGQTFVIALCIGAIVALTRGLGDE